MVTRPHLTDRWRFQTFSLLRPGVGYRFDVQPRFGGTTWFRCSNAT